MANAIKIFQAGIDAVLPSQMVKNALHVEDDKLVVNERTYQLKHNVYIAAFGKAVAGMVQAAEKQLGEHVVRGIASVPVGMMKALEDAGRSDMWPAPSSRITLIEGAQDNIPDENSLRAAQQISELAESLTEDHILLVLISGGGSALLPAPIPPVTLHQKQEITKLLASRGASIQELNTVRSSISLLKGGKLAQLARPAKVISLILSDIIGDPIDLIASGPTVPSSFVAKDCFEIITKYTSLGEIPDNIKSVINNNGNPVAYEQFSHVNNVIVGNNSKAVRASKETSERLGFDSFILSTSISGEAKIVGKHFAELAQVICTMLQDPESSVTQAAKLVDLLQSLNATDTIIKSIQRKLVSKKSICLIGAGETTVTIHGNGKGGRNQELALAAAVAMDTASSFKNCHVTFLSGGTDGQDGPTDAAGAWVHPGIVREALLCGHSPGNSLQENDSYTFFSNLADGRNLLKTGLTGTNVMDVQILLVTPRT